ncbi:MAG: HAD family hydrolase [Oscillospiraceae bacterium]|nr:HAD family hydrolase [Oscillospiraceae bacterium]
MLDAILFDLDGTLLPMDNDEFIEGYLKLIAKTAMQWGYTSPEETVAALWEGVTAMVKNNGEMSNFDAFWKRFEDFLGRDCSEDIPKFDKFYENEFMQLKELSFPTPLAKVAVDEARKRAKYVILASNPVFPLVATEMRMGWTGLNPSDFDWVTNYSNSTSCKPNPRYYKDILKRFSIDPTKCVMIGNDVREDYLASREAGVSSAFIVNDYIINRKADEVGCKNGTYRDMIDYIKSL